MPPMPTEEDVLAAIDRLAPEAADHLGDGTPLISWKQLSFALFEKGSPHWKRPEGQPHGRDQSPAVDFMDRLAFDMKSVRQVNLRGGSYFCRRKL